MPLDLNAVLTEMTALRARIESRMLGLEMLQTLALTDEEHGRVAGFHADYETRKTAVMVLIDAIQAVLDLGLPELPTFDVPQSMLDHIQQILDAIAEAEGLFAVQRIAAAVKVNFSSPEPK